MTQLMTVFEQDTDLSHAGYSSLEVLLYKVLHKLQSLAMEFTMRSLP